MNPPYRQILGIRFFVGDAAEAVRIGMRGGLVVVPSAPVLRSMLHDPFNREALLQADFAIPDSGLMVLLWNRLMGDRIPRISGLKYLQLLLEEPALRAPGATLWVMPSAESAKRILGWLRQRGFSVGMEDCHIAPRYPEGAIADEALVDRVDARKPAHVILCIGGGVQEKLGLYLRQRAAHRPAIHCTGAAISFLSGDQVNIPAWADRWYLGWAFRCLSAPGTYLPRYWKASVVIPMLLRYRDRSPAAEKLS